MCRRNTTSDHHQIIDTFTFYLEFSMAQKVTPLYAETLVLLWLWSFKDTPASRSKFITSSTKAYKDAIARLVESQSIEATKGRGTSLYEITAAGKEQLAHGLTNEDFSFSTNVGAKTVNALLTWYRQAHGQSDFGNGSQAQTNGSSNGKVDIDSYEAFAEQALETYDQLNQDYNLDDLVPIYRIRRELGDRLSRQNFNEWLLEVQANDLVQLMGGDLPNVTQDQLEDSVAIPGGGTRFYMKRL